MRESKPGTVTIDGNTYTMMNSTLYLIDQEHANDSMREEGTDNYTVHDFDAEREVMEIDVDQWRQRVMDKETELETAVIVECNNMSDGSESASGAGFLSSNHIHPRYEPRFRIVTALLLTQDPQEAINRLINGNHGYPLESLSATIINMHDEVRGNYPSMDLPEFSSGIALQDLPRLTAWAPGFERMRKGMADLLVRNVDNDLTDGPLLDSESDNESASDNEREA